MLQQSTHPSPQELAAFTLGLLPPDEASAVETHISECKPCCDTLLGLSTGDTFVAQLQEARRLPADQTVDHAGQRTDERASLVDTPAALAEHPRYEVVGLVGTGGMGDIYKARHRVMDRMVAIKVINRKLVRKSEAVERFHREVKLAASLSHPNIITSYDAEQADDVHLLVMEYVDGVDLSRRVQDRGPLPVSDACDYVQQAARGLQYAHERGMVHRDIKPHNLMVTANGTVKILDFGLATLAPEALADVAMAESRGDLTESGSIMGTPDFISPEQANDSHQADIRSDIYSLGATLYYLLSGRPPFSEGTIMQKLQCHAIAEAKPIELVRVDLPVELAEVIRRMMAKNPADRYQTPAEVADALAGLHRGESSGTVAASQLAPDPRWSSSDRIAVTTACLTAGCLILTMLGLGLTELVVVWIVGMSIGLGLTSWSGSRDTSRGTSVAGWLSWGASVALAVIIYLVTDTGTLVIESEDEHVEIAVRPLLHESRDGNKQSLAWQYRIGDTHTGTIVTRLQSGPYIVDLKGKENEYVLSQDRFVLKRGGKVIVKVSRREDAAPSPLAAAAPNEPAQAPAAVREMTWRLLPAGEFEMGSSQADLQRMPPDATWFFADFIPGRRKAETPRRRVKITKPFHVSAHEVTIGQFREFVAGTGYKTTAERDGRGYGWDNADWVRSDKFNWRNPGFDQRDNHPVCNVSWEDAVAFCHWLSKREGAIFRLPTEAEWEYACRAGTDTRFSTGDDSDSLRGFANLADASLRRKHRSIDWAVAWDDGFAETAPVGSFQPNAFGLYDMHGNAWEWCQDVYARDGYDESAVVDPWRLAGGGGGAHVFRGGGFDNWAGFLRSADRYSSHSPKIRTEWAGFRVVRETSGSESPDAKGKSQ
jgi:formylglycine-generating enzyme required for sulfatase activity/serine/threonine protein kinase